MARAAAAVLALVLGANALVQLFASFWWYGAVPGVTATGPYNPHFVRDVGAAYLVVACALAAWTWRPRAASPALAAAAGFLTLHAAVHVFDAVCGASPWRDVPGVYGPAAVTLALALAPQPTQGVPTMLRRFLLGQITRLERAFNYDASYMHFIANAAPRTLLRFSALTKLVDRQAAPAAALAAAGIVATLSEDCGPCTQISVDMAAAGGVPPQVLRAILAGDDAGMGEDAALAWRFAKASLARDLLAADPLRDEIVRRWGESGLVALAMSITTGRMYPTVKYALGYGRACSRVMVAGESAPFAQAPLLVAE